MKIRYAITLPCACKRLIPYQLHLIASDTEITLQVYTSFALAQTPGLMVEEPDILLNEYDAQLLSSVPYSFIILASTWGGDVLGA